MRGDIFRIGDEHGTLITLAYNDGTGAEAEAAARNAAHSAQYASGSRIGRTADNTVVLNHPQVSAHHARFGAGRGRLSGPRYQ